MSFNDYAHYIYQKYRLCIAIAILKTKPPDLNVTEYIEQLKSNMADKMDVDDVTVCSDDFNMSGDSVTMLHDFDENAELHGHDIGEQMPSNLPENLTQSTYCNNIQSQPLTKTSHPKNKETFNKNDHKQYHINEYEPKSINIAVNKAAKGSKNKEGNLTKNVNFDSQQTLLYAVPEFTQNFTHYSASQNNLEIPTQYLFSKIKNLTTAVELTKDQEINNSGNSHINNNDIYSQSDIFYDEILVNDNNVSQEEEIGSAVKAKHIKISETSIDVHKENMNELISKNTSESENKVPNNNNIAKKHSQNIDEYFNEIRQINNINVGVENEELMTEINDMCSNIPNYYQDANNFVKETTNFNAGAIDINKVNPNTPGLSKFNKEIVNNNASLQEINVLYTNTSNFTQNINNRENKTSNFKATVSNVNGKCQKTANIKQNFDTQTTLNTKELKPNKRIDKIMKNFDQEVEFSEKNDDFDITEDNAEVISYKVLEEMNKIKMFLRRRERRMSCDTCDSGYRSDSQSRSLKKSSLQLTGMSMNESAYCLLNHIVQTPLKHATKHITVEIAQTLCDLIKRLHEDEIYPPFLEEMLDTVDILLRQVYKGQGSDDNEFLKKEDFIERILFLNKSIHIQKHTIDKISTILSKFHQNITNENDMYVITNINEIENSSYIFHILELILKRYIKNKNEQTNSQLSQDEERILKKSSITDIWRKKWNPNLKEKTDEGRTEKGCVLKYCCEILNKIVVDCVNSYSLVSYAALKCFNTIQS